MCESTRKIKAALKQTGLQWEIKKGGKHNKVYLQNRLIAVFSRTNPGKQPKGLGNILSTIQRAARHGQEIGLRTG